jgi:phage-related baseplate assembly protein
MNTFLEGLPDISFAVKDPAVIEAEVIAYFEQISGRRLYPGDPLRLLLLGIVKYLALQRSQIDFAGKQNLIKYAVDGYLQNLAALVGTERLPPAPAVTTIKFTLSVALPSNVTVKKGTRVTPGGKLYFATDTDVDIKAGELSAEVNATCLTAGIVGNGYYPGQINMLSDPFAYSLDVANTTISQGGADLEDQEAFRERTHIAPESFSSAGPYGAYIYWAKTASQLIVDVSVVSPGPGIVEIVPLLAGGEIPTQPILDAVYDECNDVRRRPLTDYVIVRAPETHTYELTLTYYLRRKDSAIGITLQSRVNEAVAQYVKWQKSALGRDLNPSKLIEMVMAAGAKRVTVSSPAFTEMQYHEIADASAVSVTYGGLEDD